MVSQKFQTSKSLLARMFSDLEFLHVKSNGRNFLDQSQVHFSKLVNYYREGLRNPSINSSYEKEMLLRELKFWKLDPCSDEKKTASQAIYEFKKDMAIILKLQEIFNSHPRNASKEA